MGWWNRNKHEILLIGTRGHVPAPAPGTQRASVIEAATRAHSVKPEAALEMIESYFPNLPKIELHRRGPAWPGWDAWGDEARPGLP
jgi:N6-adenosine-specific RNA methylase IME4